MSEKLLTITLFEILSTFPYSCKDINTLSEEDKIQICSSVYENVGDMILWYATINEDSLTYKTFASIENYSVYIDETGLCVTFLGKDIDAACLYDEIAIAIGESILYPMSELSLSGKKYGYHFQLL